MSNDKYKAGLFYSILNPDNDDEITKIGRALSSKDRLKILRLLQNKPMNIFEISKTLDLPLSSVSFHLDALEDAKIIRFEYQPVLKGHTKLSYKNILSINIDFSDDVEEKYLEQIKVSMPIGNYSEANVSQCYLIGEDDFIFREIDFHAKLYVPERLNGQLLGFQSGKVSYYFPNLYRIHKDFTKISFSFECCSEAPYYCMNWPSEITVWINDVEIATYLSPGDYGGRRGKLTPMFWGINATQYGVLKTFSVTNEGCYLDEQLKNNKVNFNCLNLDSKDYIKLTIGIKEDAKHKGGVNLFGDKFGDYSQSIVMLLLKNVVV